jgi:hypothetical protein
VIDPPELLRNRFVISGLKCNLKLAVILLQFPS